VARSALIHVRFRPEFPGYLLTQLLVDQEIDALELVAGMCALTRHEGPGAMRFLKGRAMGNDDDVRSDAARTATPARARMAYVVVAETLSK
jgi:hypothetical protein